MRMSSPSLSSSPKWDASVWGLMTVLCGVLFLDGLDVSMVGMALPSIESDLGLTTSQLQWIVSSYVLGYGGFLLLGGRAADLLGRRRVLLIALAVFTRRLRARRPRERRDPARRRALPQGCRRGVHRARGPVDHHHAVRRGTCSQPRPEHLHRDRRQRLLARPRRRRPADRARLALDVPAPGPDRAGAARLRTPLPAARPSRAGRAPLVRPPRRDHAHRRRCCCSSARSSRRPIRAGARRDHRRVRAVAAALLARFVTIEQRARAPLVRLGILRSGRSCAPTSAW